MNAGLAHGFLWENYGRWVGKDGEGRFVVMNENGVGERCVEVVLKKRVANGEDAMGTAWYHRDRIEELEVGG